MVPTSTMQTVRKPMAMQNNVHLVLLGAFLRALLGADCVLRVVVFVVFVESKVLTVASLTG